MQVYGKSILHNNKKKYLFIFKFKLLSNTKLSEMDIADF
jgi:hypothetical protein